MNPTVIQSERQEVVVDTCVKQTDLFGGTLDFLAEPVFKKLAFLITDLVTLMVTFVAAKFAIMTVLRLPAAAVDPARYSLFAPFFFTIALYLCDGYGSAELRRPEKELELTVKAIGFAFLALFAANSLVFKGQPFSRYQLVLWLILALPCVVAGRFSLRGLYSALWNVGLAQQRALLVGSPQQFGLYRRLLRVQRHKPYKWLGILPTSGTTCLDKEDLNVSVLGTPDQWENIVQALKIQVVLVSSISSAADHPFLLQVVRRCRQLRVDVEVFSDLVELGDCNFEVDYFSGSFRLSARPGWSVSTQRIAKLFIDLVAGVLGSSVTFLLTPIVALLLKMEDGGPVFHRREFIGCDGNIHYYLKFRTMVLNADDVLRNDSRLKAQFATNHKLEHDPRVLRIGRWLRKYSIDEFPQFFSVLSGRLTLVGPRVISGEEGARYGEFLAKRLSLKPGLTGYWQVSGRQTTTYEERIQMDMFYIDHWSIWLDLVIIAKTFVRFFRPEGAY